MMKILIASALLCAVLPAAAQNTRSEAGLPPSSSSSEAISLATHLQMQTAQIERLNRLYDEYASHRRQQESEIARWQSELRQAQSPTSFDEREANRLVREIETARREVSKVFLSSRVKAFKTLTPIQRAQLEELATDERTALRDDRYSHLLLLPVEDIWQSPLQNDSNRRISSPRTRTQPNRNTRAPRQSRRRSKGSGSYGVYGGYSYGGPNYGVHGSYGQGAVTVYGGLGRGGPSIGIGIGRVFGGWLR